MVSFFVVAVAAPVSAAGVSVASLRCEHLRDPLGIDAVVPRLSWVLESDERGQHQSAYQVIVASTQEGLAEDRGDLWDSGKVDSNGSVLVPYGGTGLSSHDACCWKVRVWDKNGKPSPWSPAGHWSMGILEPDGWRASWIGKDEPDGADAELTGTNWIWFSEGDPLRAAPPGSRFFRREFRVPAGQQVRKAEMWVAADDRSRVHLNGEAILTTSGHTIGRYVEVTDRLVPGENLLAIQATNGGSGPNPAGLAVKLRIEFGDREPVTLVTDGQWKTAEQQADGWTQVAFDDEKWDSPVVLGEISIAPWGKIWLGDQRRLPAPLSPRRVQRAEARAARDRLPSPAWGCPNCILTAPKWEDDVLSPGLTEYPKRVFYVTHDVTEQVQQGENALGVILGQRAVLRAEIEHTLADNHVRVPQAVAPPADRAPRWDRDNNLEQAVLETHNGGADPRQQ